MAPTTVEDAAPGWPDEIRAGALQLERTADDLLDAAREMTSVFGAGTSGAAPPLAGRAADKAAEVFGTIPSDLRGIERSLRTVATSLRRWAQVVEDLRAEAGRAVGRARAAQERRALAEGQREEARRRLEELVGDHRAWTVVASRWTLQVRARTVAGQPAQQEVRQLERARDQLRSLDRAKADVGRHIGGLDREVDQLDRDIDTAHRDLDSILTRHREAATAVGRDVSGAVVEWLRDRSFAERAADAYVELFEDLVMDPWAAVSPLFSDRGLVSLSKLLDRASSLVAVATFVLIAVALVVPGLNIVVAAAIAIGLGLAAAKLTVTATMLIRGTRDAAGRPAATPMDLVLDLASVGLSIAGLGPARQAFHGARAIAAAKAGSSVPLSPTLLRDLGGAGSANARHLKHLLGSHGQIPDLRTVTGPAWRGVRASPIAPARLGPAAGDLLTDLGLDWAQDRIRCEGLGPLRFLTAPTIPWAGQHIIRDTVGAQP